MYGIKCNTEYEGFSKIVFSDFQYKLTSSLAIILYAGIWHALANQAERSLMLSGRVPVTFISNFELTRCTSW